MIKKIYGLKNFDVEVVKSDYFEIDGGMVAV